MMGAEADTPQLFLDVSHFFLSKAGPCAQILTCSFTLLSCLMYVLYYIICLLFYSKLIKCLIIKVPFYAFTTVASFRVPGVVEPGRRNSHFLHFQIDFAVIAQWVSFGLWVVEQQNTAGCLCSLHTPPLNSSHT